MDIVERLNGVTEGDAYASPWTFGETCKEAAAEITRLRAIVELAVKMRRLQQEQAKMFIDHRIYHAESAFDAAVKEMEKP